LRVETLSNVMWRERDLRSVDSIRGTEWDFDTAFQSLGHPTEGTSGNRCCNCWNTSFMPTNACRWMR
jgi:hypothetical protein